MQGLGIPINLRSLFMIQFWADVSCPASFQKIFRNNFAAYTEDTRIRTKIMFPGSSTGMLQVNKDIRILGPLFGFQDKNLPEKPEPFFHGDTGISDPL